MSLYLIIAAILICLGLEMMYSGGEVALFASDINKLKNRAHQGSKAAEQAVELKEKPEWFISTALVGTNLAIIIASTLATGLLISFYGPERGEQFAFLIIDPVRFFNDYRPQCVSLLRGTMAVRVSCFIRFSSMLFYPVAFVIAAVSRGTVHLSSDRKAGETSHITKEGLKYILGEKTKGGDILTRERKWSAACLIFPN